MRELADLMNDALAERSGGLTDLATVQVGARVARKVRFRRARRHTLEAGGAAAAVAVLGATTWFGMNRDDPAPAVSPTASVAPSPTPTPTQTAAVADDMLGLPPTYAMPAGLLEQSTPGWVLSIYRSEIHHEGGEAAPVAHTVVLSSPEGTLYRVVDLAVDPTTVVALRHWDAGSSTAMVSIYPNGSAPGTPGAAARAVLDLSTGTVTVDGRGLSSIATYVGEDASGAEIWAQPTSPSVDGTGDMAVLTVDGGGDARLVATLDGAEFSFLLLDPSGTRVAFATWRSDEVAAALGVVDLATGDVRVDDYGAGDSSCDVVGWADVDTLLTLCSAGGDTSDPDLALREVHIASDPFSSTLVRELGPTDEVPQGWAGAGSSDGVVVAPGLPTRLVDGCPDGVYSWSSGIPTRLMAFSTESYARVSTVDGRVYVTAWAGCDNQSLEVLTALGPSGPVVMAPAPAPRPDGQEWTTGMTSWAAAR